MTRQQLADLVLAADREARRLEHAAAKARAEAERLIDAFNRLP